MKKYDPDEPVNIHIKSLITIIQEKNWVITTKKVKGKLPFFHGNKKRVIPIYGRKYTEVAVHPKVTSTHITPTMI